MFKFFGGSFFSITAIGELDLAEIEENLSVYECFGDFLDFYLSSLDYF